MAYWFESLNNADILKYVAPEWKNYINNQMRFLRSRSDKTETGAFYSFTTNKMFFSQKDNDFETALAIFHEYGHLIHHNAFNFDETSKTIAIIFKKEIRAKKISTEEDALKLLNNLKKEFSGPYRNSLLPISDGLGIHFDTELFRNNGYRTHLKGYASYHIGTELFAELFQMTVMGDSKGLSIFKREFPKTYHYLSEKINGLRK